MRCYLVLLVLMGCSGGDIGLPDAGGDASPDALTEGGGSLGITCSGASPSFAADVKPIVGTCGGEICHSGIKASWPYSALVNVPASRDTCPSAGILVVPGSIDKSYFMHKLTGIDMCDGTQQMPMGNHWPDAKIQIVADWICQGALDN